jgi:hypothetical protein
MDATYIALGLALWCVVSIPAGLFIGTVIAVGGREPADIIDVQQAA